MKLYAPVQQALQQARLVIGESQARQKPCGVFHSPSPTSLAYLASQRLQTLPDSSCFDLNNITAAVTWRNDHKPER